MELDWQTTAAILVVILAAAVIARRMYVWLLKGGEQGCGSCPNQGSPPLVKTVPLIQIQTPAPKK